MVFCFIEHANSLLFLIMFFFKIKWSLPSRRYGLLASKNCRDEKLARKIGFFNHSYFQEIGR